MNVVLVEPEIPPNTGNIARTCAATGTKLHLVHPLGFSLKDRYLKRAGLDYWPLVEIEQHENWQAFYRKYGSQRLFFATTKARKLYHQVEYERGDFLIFGKETKGLPEELLAAHKDFCIRVPMRQLPQARSLNLSTTVGIVLYEALRQLDFPSLK